MSDHAELEAIEHLRAGVADEIKPMVDAVLGAPASATHVFIMASQWDSGLRLHIASEDECQCIANLMNSDDRQDGLPTGRVIERDKFIALMRTLVS